MSHLFHAGPFLGNLHDELGVRQHVRVAQALRQLVVSSIDSGQLIQHEIIQRLFCVSFYDIRSSNTYIYIFIRGGVGSSESSRRGAVSAAVSAAVEVEQPTKEYGGAHMACVLPL